MIGLERNTVKVVPYRKEWSDIYKETEVNLYRLLKGEIIQIEHIGSTAIKGMAAKPIIDIAIAVKDYDNLKEIQRILNENKYEDRGLNKGGYLFVKRVAELTTHHIHFVIHTSQKWKHYVAFKNKLNNDKGLRDKYSKLKQHNAEKYAEDRGAYTGSKSDFIEKLLKSIED